jgi:nifR3 family TIM-barrel protein
VQIFGADPLAMGEAAALVTDVFQPEFIDINFGCPVKKVVKRNGGSGCLRDLGLVQDVIRAVSRSTSLPVTCKIRSGWNEEMRDPVTIALRCQDAGARVLTLHPRTRTQMYSGNARWEEIAAVVQALDIPVLGNGDIKTPADAYRMWRETRCAGVMIARGSFGQPWIFDQTRDLLDGRAMRPDPPVEQRFAVALEHARMAADYEPDPRGAAIEFRKHLGWYVKGLPGSADLRKKLHAVTALGEVEGIFEEYLQTRDRWACESRAGSEEGEPLETVEV